MAVKNAVYQVDNGSGFDEIHFRTKAAMVKCNNGKDLETNLSEIVSRGSNSQGTWTRFADGTQICRGSEFMGFTFNKPYGAAYYGVGYNKNFPVPFIERPEVFPLFQSAGGGFVNLASRDENGLGCFVYDMTQGYKEGHLSYIAIGRWK